MEKHSAIFIIAIVALFSVAIVSNLFYAAKSSGFSLTGMVTSDLSVGDGEICVDSDDGRAYLKGTVSVYNSELEDYCLDDTRLVEYSCDSLFRTKSVHVCPFGCINGACI